MRGAGQGHHLRFALSAAPHPPRLTQVSGQVEDALPVWKGGRFAAVGLGVMALALATQCRDRYPIVPAPPGPCAPCVCSDEGVLQGCPFHAEIKDPILWIRSVREQPRPSQPPHAIPTHDPHPRTHPNMD